MDSLSSKRGKVEMEGAIASALGWSALPVWLVGIEALCTEGDAAAALPTASAAAATLSAWLGDIDALPTEGAEVVEAYELVSDTEAGGAEPRYNARAKDGGLLFYPAAVEGVAAYELLLGFSFKRISELPGVKRSPKNFEFKYLEEDLDESLVDEDPLMDAPCADDDFMGRAGDAWKERGDTTLKDNEPLVVIAAHLGMPRAVQKILAGGALVDTTCSSGMTGLMHAAKQGELGTMCVLLDAGAKIDAVSPPYGRTALMHAVEAGQCKTANALIHAGANIETRDNNDYTALLLAVKAREPLTGLLLLRSGADPNVKNCWGDTLLHILCGCSAGHDLAVLNPKS